jgi:cytochrome c
MKTLTINAIVALFIMSSLFTGTGFAAESATVDEAYAKVLAGAGVMESLGVAGLAAFNDPKGEFVWKDSYTTIVDCQKSEIVAHPSPKLIGLSSDVVKDMKTGKLVIKEFCEASNPHGTWLEYWWTKPGGEEKMFRKLMFAIPVEGTPYIVAAGIYDENMTLEELNK